jgi:PAP2 superfamily
MTRKLALALVVSTALVAPATASADVVTTWNRTMVAALDTANTPPPPAMRAAAIVQAAVFDAVNGIARRYTPVHVQPAARPGASRVAAAASAAHEALVALFPAQQAMFDQRLVETLSQISDDDGGGRSIASGLAWGKTVADEILAWRANDGFSAALPPYVPVGASGRWQPTPPAFVGPLFRQFATMTPWALASPSQFLPGAPPPLSSARYAQDLNEVKPLGSATSAVRTAFQTETARFWNADTPAAIWNRVADDLAERHDASLLTNARVLALTNIALADAVIAIWNAKNTFDTWRPITAIEQAATDGNPDTSPDPLWAPLIATPAFQEYPAGHPGVSNAGASVLAHFYGNDTSFTATSFGLPGVEHSFASFSSAVAEVENARVWGGIHFRFACETGAAMGAAVAEYVTRTQLLTIHGPGEEVEDGD